MLNKYSGKEMSPIEEADVNNFFWKDKISETKIEKMNAMRSAGSDLCQLIISLVPNSADRSAAIRYLRLAIMQCNSAITNHCEE